MPLWIPGCPISTLCGSGPLCARGECEEAEEECENSDQKNRERLPS